MMCLSMQKAFVILQIIAVIYVNGYQRQLYFPDYYWQLNISNLPWVHMNAYSNDCQYFEYFWNLKFLLLLDVVNVNDTSYFDINCTETMNPLYSAISICGNNQSCYAYQHFTYQRSSISEASFSMNNFDFLDIDNSHDGNNYNTNGSVFHIVLVYNTLSDDDNQEYIGDHSSDFLSFLTKTNETEMSFRMDMSYYDGNNSTTNDSTFFSLLSTCIVFYNTSFDATNYLLQDQCAQNIQLQINPQYFANEYQYGLLTYSLKNITQHDIVKKIYVYQLKHKITQLRYV